MGRVITSQPKNTTRYITLIFRYEDVYSSYDTKNIFVQSILGNVDNYNEHRPTTSSTRYDLEEVYTSIEKPQFKGQGKKFTEE